ncbi:uncharacterized protein [Parasteatoda tepidariorum]|uniref:uncharacterized protein n=1 Tax=Parasteatoda tepidariorum TaxID=114398 RepID=UPI0039BCEB22
MLKLVSTKYFRCYYQVEVTLQILLIRRSHEKLGHAGVADTLTDVRETFWIIKGRQRIKSIIFNCNLCKKFRAKPFTQDEAPLPPDRIKQVHPFEVAGIDYAAPLYVKSINGMKKDNISLFTCAVTRAVHLELTEDLTTKTFRLAFRKFVSRRGLCRKLYSDNAKTFKRAKIEINLQWKFLKDKEIQNYFATKNIEWNFIIKRAAWWGGFWERLIKSTKICLWKILGRIFLTFPELETIVIEVEAIINSRPLTFVYSDIEEPEPLTPGNFLIGRRLVALPQLRLNQLLANPI